MSGPRKCECCDHPLQHLISGVLARDRAPIPYEGRTHASLMRELADGLFEWEAEQSECVVSSPETPEETPQ